MKILLSVILLMGVLSRTVIAAEADTNKTIRPDNVTSTNHTNKINKGPVNQIVVNSTNEKGSVSLKDTTLKLANSPELNHSNNGSVLQLFYGLFVVILTIIVIVWLMKRFSRFNYAGHQTVKMLGGISLGAREKIVLIEIGKEQLLIGVAPGRVNLLHQLQEPIIVEESRESFQSVFGQRVKDLFNRDKK